MFKIFRLARFLIAGWLFSLPVAAFNAGHLTQFAHAVRGHLQPHQVQAAAHARDSDVFVDEVLDGDTVIVRGWRERVRLANIDAPERSHGRGRPGQPYSVQATKWLSDRLKRASGVSAKCVDQDRYGRRVCDFYRDGAHVNKELVLHGLAWANTANPRYLRDKSVLAAQQEAQAAKRGLWADRQPIVPWNWRHECWEKLACSPAAASPQ